jgi:hypothetical protein
MVFIIIVVVVIIIIIIIIIIIYIYILQLYQLKHSDKNILKEIYPDSRVIMKVGGWV